MAGRGWVGCGLARRQWPASDRFASRFPVGTDGPAGEPRRSTPRAWMRLSRQQQRYVADALTIVPVAVRTFRKRHPAWRSLLSRMDVEGVAHLAICRAARTYDPKRSQVTTYFGTAIRNALVKAAQREFRYVQAHSQEVPVPMAPDLQHLSRRRVEQLQGAVQLALARLPDKQKFILHLKFARRMTLRQIAEAAGRSAPTIQRLLDDALDQLETLLRSEFGRQR